MYLIDFFRKLFKSKNIGIIIWLFFNSLMFIIPFMSMYPDYPILGLFCGIVVYAGMLAIALSSLGEWFFRLINGCKKIIDPRILNRLIPLFNEVYARAKMKDPILSPNIRLYMINDHYPNAFALGRNTVCVTRGLLYLDDEKIKGIFAHEFSHLSNKDTDFLLFIYIGNLVMTCGFMIARAMIWIISFFLGVATSDHDDYDVVKGLRGLIFARLADLLYVIAVGLYTKLGLILVRHSMRNQEYEADKFAYDLGYGEQLRDALTQLQDTNEAPKKFAANLMSTHPDMFSRIDKLNMYLFQNGPGNYNFYENAQTNDPGNYNFYENAQTNDPGNYNFYGNAQTNDPGNYNFYGNAQANDPGNYNFYENTQTNDPGNYNFYENTQTNGPGNYDFYGNAQTNGPGNYDFYRNTQTKNSSNKNLKALLPLLYILIACLAGYMFFKMNNNKNNNTVAIKHTIPGSSQKQVMEQNNTKENNNEIHLKDNNQTNTNSQDISDINLANKDFSGFSEQPSQNMTDLENINYLASNLPSADFLRANFSSEELALLRNTIYAKYNRRFQTPKYSSYFSRKTWYRGEYNEVSERNFSQNEFDLLNNILMAEGKSTLSR